MDSTDNASRVLKDMLKIGQTSDTGNGAGVSTSENHGDQERHQSDFGKSKENNVDVDLFESIHEQMSPRIALDAVHQLVYFSPVEEKDGSVVIYGNEVHITTGEIEARTPTSAGSNRVRINPVVNFDWEWKYYNGNLLSVSAKYICYALKGKSGFVVRILNRKTLLKALIKDFTGSIEDLSFAHYNSDVLACTDSAGDIFVWNIYEEDDKICYNVKLHLKRTSAQLAFLEGTRLTWCPYTEDNETDDEEGESGQILAVTVGDFAEVLHISMITQSCGSVVDIEDVKQGIVRIENGHTQPIRDIALAPDGSVLATASEDGGVKFWQLDFNLDPPRCLHEWQPHDGKPVSRLIFCDNLTLQNDKNPFWRFLITGANHNSELKIWCTVTWTCLQTLSFELPASSLSLCPPPPLKFKASLDLSARYLVLSDVYRKVLYVFLLHEDLDQGKAHLTSVALFPLAQPLLSFVISEARIFKASLRDSMDQSNGADGKESPEDDQDMEEPAEPKEDEEKLLPTIKIKLHCINRKAMQELTVQYHPFASIRPESPSTIANLSMTTAETGVQDGLSDVSGLDSSSTDDLESKSDHSTAPKLIAPNAFTTSMTQATEQPVEPASNMSSITSVTSINNTSFDSVSVPDLLEHSHSTQVSESAFQTCDEESLQQEPTRRAALPSLIDHTSPLGLTLPESPDPAKVPFPAFKHGEQKHARDAQVFSALSHSTPISRRSPDAGRDDETEKTPTGENQGLPSEHGTTFEGNSANEWLHRETVDHQLNQSPSQSHSNTLLKPGDLGQTEEDVNVLPTEEDIEVTFANLQMTELDTSAYQNKRPQQQKPNLTVTPRKQINISPETTRERRSSDAKESSLKMDEILALLQAQHNEIKQLKSAQQNQNQQVSEILREEVAMLEAVISSKVEAALADHARDQDQRLDSIVREKQSGEKQKYEKVANAVSAAVTTKVEKTVKNEVRNSVSSGFQKVTASLQDQLNNSLAQKLTATDAALKEGVQKMLKDKDLVDAIGNSVSNAMHKRLQEILSDFTTNSMLPGFEKACQALYIQMNNAFQKGTQQYIHSFETYAENQREIQRDERDPVVQQLQALVQAFKASSEKMSTSMTGSLLEMMQTQLTSSMKRLQSALMSQLNEDLNKSLQETIQKEVRSAVGEHSLSEVTSPQAYRRTQLHIQELINGENFAEAFQEALTAADLNLVVMVCHACDPVGLFSQNPCPLNQPILLSLIQQLSVDLSTDTEVKQKYLTEAIVALDTNDPITKEHVTSILDGLCLQIKATMHILSRTDPSTSLMRSLKMLLMAAQSLIK